MICLKLADINKAMTLAPVHLFQLSKKLVNFKVKNYGMGCKVLSQEMHIWKVLVERLSTQDPLAQGLQGLKSFGYEL